MFSVARVHNGHGQLQETYLLQVERRALATVVIVAVHVQNLLALDGENTAEDALRQARAEHDHVVGFVLHGGRK